MIEYPSIQPSSKAPHANCVAFLKYDGSNIRVKYTNKKGFDLFGSRTQLIDKTHPHLGESIDIFHKKYEDKLIDVIKKYYSNEREVIAFLEFFGPNSFAGFHVKEDPKDLILFDLMVGHKNRKFLLPQEFIKITTKFDIQIPKIVYEGNLTDQFIKDVREGKYDSESPTKVFEGVVGKGTERSGAYRGGVCMTKIKTNKYFELLNNRFGEEEAKKYGE
jgi:hypothetical protein